MSVAPSETTWSRDCPGGSGRSTVPASAGRSRSTTACTWQTGSGTHENALRTAAVPLKVWPAIFRAVILPLTTVSVAAIEAEEALVLAERGARRLALRLAGADRRVGPRRHHLEEALGGVFAERVRVPEAVVHRLAVREIGVARPARVRVEGLEAVAGRGGARREHERASEEDSRLHSSTRQAGSGRHVTVRREFSLATKISLVILFLVIVPLSTRSRASS